MGHLWLQTLDGMREGCRGLLVPSFTQLHMDYFSIKQKKQSEVSDQALMWLNTGQKTKLIFSEISSDPARCIPVHLSTNINQTGAGGTSVLSKSRKRKLKRFAKLANRTNLNLNTCNIAQSNQDQRATLWDGNVSGSVGDTSIWQTLGSQNAYIDSLHTNMNEESAGRDLIRNFQESVKTADRKLFSTDHFVDNRRQERQVEPIRREDTVIEPHMEQWQMEPKKREKRWIKPSKFEDSRVIKHNRKKKKQMDHNKIKENWTEPNRREQPWAEPNRREENWTEPNRREEPWAEPNRREENWTEPNRRAESWTEPNRREKNWTEPNRREENWTEPNRREERWVEPNRRKERSKKSNRRKESWKESNRRKESCSEPNRREEPWAEPNRREEPWVEPNRREEPWAEPNRREENWTEPNRREEPWAEPNRREEPWAEPNRKEEPWAEPNRREENWTEPNRREESWEESDRRKESWVEPNRREEPWAEPNRREEPWAEPNRREENWTEPNRREENWTEPNRREEHWAEPNRREEIWTEPNRREENLTESTRREENWTEPNRREESWIEPNRRKERWVELNRREERWIEPSKREEDWMEPTRREERWIEHSRRKVKQMEPNKEEQRLEYERWGGRQNIDSCWEVGKVNIGSPTPSWDDPSDNQVVESSTVPDSWREESYGSSDAGNKFRDGRSGISPPDNRYFSKTENVDFMERSLKNYTRNVDDRNHGIESSRVLRRKGEGSYGDMEDSYRSRDKVNPINSPDDRYFSIAENDEMLKRSLHSHSTDLDGDTREMESSQAPQRWGGIPFNYAEQTKRFKGKRSPENPPDNRHCSTIETHYMQQGNIFFKSYSSQEDDNEDEQSIDVPDRWVEGSYDSAEYRYRSRDLRSPGVLRDNRYLSTDQIDRNAIYTPSKHVYESLKPQWKEKQKSDKISCKEGITRRREEFKERLVGGLEFKGKPNIWGHNKRNVITNKRKRRIGTEHDEKNQKCENRELYVKKANVRNSDLVGSNPRPELIKYSSMRVPYSNKFELKKPKIEQDDNPSLAIPSSSNSPRTLITKRKPKRKIRKQAKIKQQNTTNTQETDPEISKKIKPTENMPKIPPDNLKSDTQIKEKPKKNKVDDMNTPGFGYMTAPIVDSKKVYPDDSINKLVSHKEKRDQMKKNERHYLNVPGFDYMIDPIDDVPDIPENIEPNEDIFEFPSDRQESVTQKKKRNKRKHPDDLNIPGFDYMTDSVEMSDMIENINPPNIPKTFSDGSQDSQQIKKSKYNPVSKNKFKYSGQAVTKQRNLNTIKPKKFVQVTQGSPKFTQKSMEKYLHEVKENLKISVPSQYGYGLQFASKKRVAYNASRKMKGKQVRQNKKLQVSKKEQTVSKGNKKIIKKNLEVLDEKQNTGVKEDGTVSEPKMNISQNHEKTNTANDEKVDGKPLSVCEERKSTPASDEKVDGKPLSVCEERKSTPASDEKVDGKPLSVCEERKSSPANDEKVGGKLLSVCEERKSSLANDENCDSLSVCDKLLKSDEKLVINSKETQQSCSKDKFDKYATCPLEVNEKVVDVHKEIVPSMDRAPDLTVSSMNDNVVKCDESVRDSSETKVDFSGISQEVVTSKEEK